jgi:membrane protein DedA with SNARE-associated domain
LSEAAQILTHYGYLVVFVWVLAEQIGLPIPAIPLLLTAGALCADHRMSLFLVLFTSMFASLVSDSLWFELGRRRGGVVLNILCRMSLEPDSCVERTKGSFDRRGPQSLLYSKFVPGLNTVAAPIAGMARISYSRFLLFDIAGTFLWAGSALFTGYLLGKKVDKVLSHSRDLGQLFIVLALTAILGWIVWKWDQRRRFLASVRVARIMPQDLHEKMLSGEPMVIIDLRHRLDLLTDPRTLPGALRIKFDELEERAKEIPRDREIILYCT